MIEESTVYDETQQPVPTSVIPRGFAGFSFDAIVYEKHTLETEVTEYPVETGVAITDHAYIKPNRVMMRVGVSNHQLLPFDDGFGIGDARIVNAFRRLELLMRTREPFDVQTGLRLYNNMICKTLVVDQEASSANALIFECELREIIIVNTEVVTYPPRAAGKATNQASKKKDSGEKQGKEVTQPAKKTSLLKGLSNALKGTP